MYVTCLGLSVEFRDALLFGRHLKWHLTQLELCEGRARHLRSEGQMQVLSPTDFLKLPGSFGQKAFSHSIRSLQELLKLFGINYGEEFRVNNLLVIWHVKELLRPHRECTHLFVQVALEEGDKIGADLHYIDQNIDVSCLVMFSLGARDVWWINSHQKLVNLNEPALIPMDAVFFQMLLSSRS